MPMFPNSGVPANEARNSIDVTTVTPCDELWYSTSRCQPRFDPAAANAMLAEDMNLIMKGEVVYDCKNLDHIERAVRYINQRGLPRGCFMFGGPNAYTGALDPPCTRYNDYMTLTVIPAQNCTNGGITFDAGRGPASLLRNDGKPLQYGDLLQGKPAIIAFYSGYWYMVGLVTSQVPILSPALDFWIRTDGNDITGDGTANTPGKAFKTIQGCWLAVGSRYAATPTFSINMRLGIPGTYDGAFIAYFGGSVSLTGDPNNPAGYIVAPVVSGSAVSWYNLWVEGVSQFTLRGVTLLQNKLPPNANNMLRCITSKVYVTQCLVDIIVSNILAVIFELEGGRFALIHTSSPAPGTISVNGNNNQIGSIVAASMGSTFNSMIRANAYDQGHWYFNNLMVDYGMASTGLSVLDWQAANSVSNVNCIGIQYFVIENSIINAGGHSMPGNQPGPIASGGRYIP